MDQHPKVTVNWALHGLEMAIRNLGEGWAERRVRRQFHQLLLAVEREATSSPVESEFDSAQATEMSLQD